MKKLFLIRHAKAEEGSFSKKDIYRNITPKGEGDALNKSLILSKFTQKIDLIISSDANRAFQTAEIFAKTYNYSADLIIKEHFIYKDYDPIDLLHYINQISNDVETVMIFGHNPNIAYAAAAFCNQHIPSFTTSCVASITFDSNNWQDATLNSGTLNYLLNN